MLLKEAWSREADDLELRRALVEWDRDQKPEALQKAVTLAIRQGREEVVSDFLADYAGDLYESDEWFIRNPSSAQFRVESERPLRGFWEISWLLEPDLEWTLRTGIPTCRVIAGSLHSAYINRTESNLPEHPDLRFEIAYLFHLAAGEGATNRAVYTAFPGPSKS